MKKLVNPQVAVREEDLNLLSRLKGFSNRKLKTVKSIAIAMGYVMASVVVSVPRAQADIGLLRAREGLAGAVSAPQNPLSNRVFNRNSGRQGTEISGESQSGKPKGTVGGPMKQAVSPRQPLTPQHAAVKHGKLILRNDTESGTLIFLHAPGAERFSRYAYIPACFKREMSAAYSTEWQASLDTENLHKVEVGKGDTLGVSVSKLYNHKDGTACDAAKRSQARTVAGALTARHTRNAEDMPVATPVRILPGFPNLKADNKIARATVVDTRNNANKLASDPTKAAKEIRKGIESLDRQLEEIMKRVLQYTGDTRNINDDEELLEVARFIKGDGSNNNKASQILDSYLNTCGYPFASTADALQLLDTMQVIERNKQNLQADLIIYNGLTLRKLGNSYVHYGVAPSLAVLNKRITPKNPPKQFDGLNCVKDKSNPTTPALTTTI